MYEEIVPGYEFEDWDNGIPAQIAYNKGYDVVLIVEDDRSFYRVEEITIPREEIIEWIKAIVIQYIDREVRNKDYDGILECISYVHSSNTAWKAEAEAAIAWRDAVWNKYYEIIANPPTSKPSAQYIIDQLPKLEW